MSYHRTPAGLIKMPRKSPVAAYLKGRPVVTARPHRDPDRATLHPGKAIKKAMRRARVFHLRAGTVATMAEAHRYQGWLADMERVGDSLDESAAGFDRLREAVDRSGEAVKAFGSR